QWSQEITTQLAVQNGEVIEQNQIDMPFWLNNVTTMTELNREQAGQLAIRSIEEQLEDRKIVLEDFILGGRLATYPTEGTHFLDQQILENLEIGSELTAKEGRLVTAFINKKIKQFHKQIVLARQQQKQQVRTHFNQLTKIEKKLQRANETVERNLSKQQGPSKTAAARNLFPIFNSQNQRMTRSRSRSKARAKAKAEATITSVEAAAQEEKKNTPAQAPAKEKKVLIRIGSEELFQCNPGCQTGHRHYDKSTGVISPPLNTPVEAPATKEVSTSWADDEPDSEIIQASVHTIEDPPARQSRKNKRAIQTVNEVKLAMQNPPTNSWQTKVKIHKLGAPPTNPTTTGATATSAPVHNFKNISKNQVQTPLFENNETIPENPFLWNGNLQTAPEWTQTPVSADSLSLSRQNHLPGAHRQRNLQQ
ncbi:MAG: hypothetical protein ACOYB0_11080, partial [Polynucleobacter sp.]